MEIKSYKKGSKTLYSCRIWYRKNKKKKSKYQEGFVKKKKAEEWGDTERKRLMGLTEGADKMTVSNFLDRWINMKVKKLSPTTLSGYKVNIKHIKEYIGDILLYDLNLMDVQDMLDSLSEEGLKYRTVHYVYRTLHAALNYAVKAGFAEKNVCIGAEFNEDEEAFKAIIYPADLLNKLIELLREQSHFLYPYVLLASLRGLRRGECLGLSWADIDFKEGIAHIRNNYVLVNGKPYIKKVKTKDSERVTDMEGFVADELLTYKERVNKGRKAIQTYVFELPDGTLPCPTHISRSLRRFQAANDLPECRFHDLRHTFAMLQLENGTDLDTLRRMLGHSKIGITSNLYLHPNVTLIKKASRKLDNVVVLHCDEIVTNSKNEASGNLK